MSPKEQATKAAENNTPLAVATQSMIDEGNISGAVKIILFDTPPALINSSNFHLVQQLYPQIGADRQYTKVINQAYNIKDMLLQDKDKILLKHFQSIKTGQSGGPFPDITDLSQALVLHKISFIKDTSNIQLRMAYTIPHKKCPYTMESNQSSDLWGWAHLSKEYWL
eukprot:12249301-Ditylum_brightwellii.AAC.1